VALGVSPLLARIPAQFAQDFTDKRQSRLSPAIGQLPGETVRLFVVVFERLPTTPKALNPIAWGQPRSGATPGEVTPANRTLQGFHKSRMALCNPCRENVHYVNVSQNTVLASGQR
jgi:hypothetical protein